MRKEGKKDRKGERKEEEEERGSKGREATQWKECRGERERGRKMETWTGGSVECAAAPRAAAVCVALAWPSCQTPGSPAPAAKREGR